jgi:low temperature requirement protein LtrA
MYTWTTNWTGTSSTSTRLFILGAMGTTLLMALAVPQAFGDGSRWFAVTYFAVRVLASGLYWVASKSHPEQRAAFYTFFPLAGAASVLVLIGGFLEPPWLGVFWVAGAVLDIVGAVNAGKGSWAIDAKHFAERNGLFIIIALGESVVGLGLAATGAERDTPHITALAIAFVGVAAIWWSYFDRAAPRMEAHLTQLTGQERGRFARDAYSILHYPLVVGIVFYALALEDVVAHPTDPISPEGRFAMAVGVALVLLSVVGAAYRAIRRIPTERLAAAVILIALAWLSGSMDAQIFASIVTAILVVSLAIEHIRLGNEAAHASQSSTPI